MSGSVQTPAVMTASFSRQFCRVFYAACDEEANMEARTLFGQRRQTCCARDDFAELSDAHETCMFTHNEDSLMQPSLSLHSCSHVQIKCITVTCCKACK